MKLLFIVLISLFTTAAHAASSGQDALVKIDSAMVYDQPSFDGAVVEYLKAGQKVRVSTKIFGSEVGRFFMIRLKNGKFGYIADIDVQVKKAGNKSVDKKKKSKSKGRSEDDEEERRKEEAEERAEAEAKAERDRNRAPLAFTQVIGPYYASWGYKEEIGGIDASERISVFGIKYTTPKLSPGTVLDFNLGFHFGAPDYYQQISTSKPKGYIVLLDAEFLSPLILAQNSFGYLGLGPLINYSSIRIESLGQPVDSNDLRLGLALTLGYAHRFGDICGKLEGKYIFEKTQQTVFVLSVQLPL